MTTEIRVPTLGESVTEATVGKWFKKLGEAVAIDEPLVELETDKVTVEVPSPVAGKLFEIIAKEGDTVEVNALLGAVEAGAASVAKSPSSSETSVSAAPSELEQSSSSNTMPPAPSAAKLMAENNIAKSDILGSGKRGQILKEDVLNVLAQGVKTSPPAVSASSSTPVSVSSSAVAPVQEMREERVRMTKLRQTIARRLKDAQNTAAMLTTFNEVDMSAVMGLRKRYKDLFEKKHGVKLGFMGFFTKAVCHALKELPAVNAEIDGTDIIYKNYVNAGIAVGTDKGLVVPVVRDADQMSLAEIEKEIGRLGRLARDGKLAVSDMQGGTFTITNGGVYGSLMSTPILNAPQSGILGMHAIKERAMVVDGQIAIRPMMYLALSYDHRIVDGQEAVTFLVRVKESLEDPERLVLDL
ncbi:2-oxoglutarate dehydrogenase complex dihydrolipoyllysine-residue succinyltransferase [Bartonella vinsonii]|uniref:Dihydrolipoyllysine-residue succinyltransferase component of 2-oxoglutarate dehydrogenase complex n=2 Tax=Bartonella vinsonii subsp. berkhoffii TaxID=40933 RepID=ODO2_BARVB|nr:2-oxoglutarate dehydrogenase complex dihydrolipoyllysine-residue succinyltransferase [Bartonella vinsonii]Q8GCY1.1 RecName: Full=Dihydrolipoyllysine-residue succinyltransferase component of 2-oxoglutarate dehydrogenase complex; AltName: Full=2-oxoglutarate dehydrogenase complex component E2; Short=OGDC-E2; AltName: Full=Dihydrolipoamide succinyltransferase component of 2-oxoglutarate dehydrogenase complex [Bartonella vinsonii subsp. berkhoffii]AAN78227.1 dihydrolipoamide succinyltransferase [B